MTSKQITAKTNTYSTKRGLDPLRTTGELRHLYFDVRSAVKSNDAAKASQRARWSASMALAILKS